MCYAVGLVSYKNVQWDHTNRRLQESGYIRERNERESHTHKSLILGRKGKT